MESQVDIANTILVISIVGISIAILIDNLLSKIKNALDIALTAHKRIDRLEKQK